MNYRVLPTLGHPRLGGFENGIEARLFRVPRVPEPAELTGSFEPGAAQSEEQEGTSVPTSANRSMLRDMTIP